MYIKLQNCKMKGGHVLCFVYKNFFVYNQAKKVFLASVFLFLSLNDNPFSKF